jgi:hypothetical protein
MDYTCIDMRDLAEELSDLNEQCEDGELLSALSEEDNDWREALLKLEQEMGGNLQASADNEPTMIAEQDFEAYAQELAEDIGAIDRNANWPLNHIDWEAAANELKQDYMSVEFDGETYLVRSC